MRNLLFPLLLLAAGPAIGAEPIAPKAQQTKFPTLIVETIADGRFDLAEQRGKWVVVNFWATWCAPCIKEIPDLSRFDRERDDVRVIGLAFEQIERSDLLAFLKRHPASYPIAVVDVYDPPKDFDVPRGLPTTYLIAPDGRLAQRFIGPVTSVQLAKAIAATGTGT